MRFTDFYGREFATVAEVQGGDRLISDGTLPCTKQGEEIEVNKDAFGILFFKCSHGLHGLEDQRQDRDGFEPFYMGLYRRTH